jgi:Holliday junction resolvase RusA-like endonuclease
VTERLVFSLAGPPRGKGRHRARIARSKAGAAFVQSYPDGATVKYETQLRYVAQQQMGDRPPWLLPVRVHVEVLLPIAQSGAEWEKEAKLAGAILPAKRGSGDADNFLKIVGDSLNGIVWVDDSQIVEATVIKRYAVAPRLSVVAETLEPPPERPGRRARLAASQDDLFAAV